MKKRAVPAPQDSITVKLRRTLGDRSEVVLRRITGAELRPLPLRVLRSSEGRSSGATWGDFLTIASGCSGIEVDDLKSLCAKDAAAVLSAVNEFFAFDMAQARAERVKEHSNGGVTVRLARPLQLGSQTLAALEFKPCSGAELWDLPIEPGIDDLLNLSSRLTLQPAAILDRLDVEDALPLITVANLFFDRSRETGE